MASEERTPQSAEQKDNLAQPVPRVHTAPRLLRVVITSVLVVGICIAGLFAFDLYQQGYDSLIWDDTQPSQPEEVFDPATITEDTTFEQIDDGYDQLCAQALEEYDCTHASQSACLNVANSYFNWGMALLSKSSNTQQDEYVQGLFMKSYEYYGEYLKISSIPAVEVNSAIALFYAGDSDKAIQALEELVQQQPTYAPAWSNLGLFYESEERLDDAVDAYTKACQSTSDEPGVEQARMFAQERLDALDE